MSTNHPTPTAAPAAIDPEFAGRLLHYYGGQLADSVAPSETVADLTGGSWLPSVTDGTRHAIDATGGIAPAPGTDAPDEQSVHEAFERIAAATGHKCPTLPDKFKRKGGNGTPPPPPPGGQPGDGDGDGTGNGPGKGGTPGNGTGEGEGGGDGKGKAPGTPTRATGTGHGPANANGSTYGGTNTPPPATRDLPPVTEAAGTQAAKQFAAMPDVELPPVQKSRMTRENYFRPGTRFQHATMNGLGAQLRRELASIRQSKITRNRRRGAIDFTSKIVELGAGHTDKVRFTKKNSRQINTAVQIMLDLSSSTDGTCNQTMTGLALHLARNLEKLRVPVQIIGFRDGATLVKDWHERADACRIELVDDYGGTNLPNAQAKAADVLAGRRERRRVQLVITDGDVGWVPDADRAAGEKQITDYAARSYTTDAERERYVKEARAGLAKRSIRMLQARCPGVETLAFGVHCEIPRGIFDFAVGQLTADDMREKITAALGRAIMAPHA